MQQKLTPRQQQVLKEFSGRLSTYLNGEIQKVAAEVDYAMVFSPLVSLAVQALKTRGLSRDGIEQAIMQTVDAQLQSDGPSLIVLPGGKL